MDTKRNYRQDSRTTQGLEQRTIEEYFAKPTSE